MKKSLTLTLTALALTLTLSACADPSSTTRATMAASLISPQAAQLGAYLRLGQIFGARNSAPQ